MYFINPILYVAHQTSSIRSVSSATVNIASVLCIVQHDVQYVCTLIGVTLTMQHGFMLSSSFSLAGDWNAQVRELSALEACLGEHYISPAQHTENGDRLPQFCANNLAILSSTDFQHSLRCIAIQRPNATGIYIAAGYRWYGPTENCTYYWSSGPSSLILMWFLLQVNGHQGKPQTRLAVKHLSAPNVRTICGQKLCRPLT